MVRTILWTGALVLLCTASAQAGATADAAVKKGFLRCGVNTGIAGFAQPDSKGEWRGIDIDFCRAVAAALFRDAQKVRYTPLSTQQRFTALQSGEVDILSRNTTWTMARDTSLGLNFVGINFYDGQGFMVAKKRPHNSTAPRYAYNRAPPPSSISPTISALII
jgi:general L-amino acid transport system substrate-binding protein